MKAIIATVAIALIAGSVASGFGRKAQSTAPAVASSASKADVGRGKMLFDKTLRCYACHGFGGQTGTPRLVPMTRSEEAFITYLRKPATPAMPAFADVPRQDLVDVYAYIKSLPTDAPAVDSIPLLRDLIERSTGR
jgi:mono/diheme cytochrome c family protein